MADDTTEGPTTARPLIEVSPELAERLRDPRMVLAGVAAVGGAIALFVGYLGVSGTLDPAKQLPYLVSGGVGGLFLLGVATALLFSSDLGEARREVRELRQVVDRMAAQLEDLAAAPPAPAATNGTASRRRTRTSTAP